jgi:hypothetical protein
MASQRSDEEQDERAFTISDKRLFAKDGTRRTADDQQEAARPSPPPPPPQAEAPRPQEPPRRRPEMGEPPPRDLPPADFSTFMAMLANNVLMLLGQIPDPVTQQRRRDLVQARHTIDILMMLREKTQGNLTPDEDALLQDLLPQLQMAYVQATRQVG